MSGECVRGMLVKCIDSSATQGCLQLGHIYRVSKTDAQYVYLADIRPQGWYKWRFAFIGDEDGI